MSPQLNCDHCQHKGRLCDYLLLFVDASLCSHLLDQKLAKAVKENIINGRIDVIIGVDQLYGRISYTNTTPHPDRRLAIISTIFGPSLGGSTAKKFEISEKEQTNLNILTFATETTEKKYY